MAAISLPPLPQNRLVVSCGMVFLDHVAIVDSFPKPDEKIRGRNLQADQMNIPILLDAERSKTGLKSLLDLASYVICSEKFPEAWTTFPSMPRALISLVQLPRVKFIIVTLGEKGCIMIEKCTRVSNVDDGDVECVYESLKSKVDNNDVLPTCIASKDMMLYADRVGHVSGRLLLGTAETIPSSDLVDTTGAGDAFNGAILYALCAEMPPEKMLPFASRVAAANCKALGARAGLPRRDDPCLAAFL